MLTVLKYGGFTRGGVNFDAKVRRESFTPEDLFYAHIAGMDTFARGLKIAARVRRRTSGCLHQEPLPELGRGHRCEKSSRQGNLRRLRTPRLGIG